MKPLLGLLLPLHAANPVAAGELCDAACLITMEFAAPGSNLIPLNLNNNGDILAVSSNTLLFVNTSAATLSIDDIRVNAKTDRDDSGSSSNAFDFWLLTIGLGLLVLQFRRS